MLAVTHCAFSDVITPATASSRSIEIDALVQQLADPDPAVRGEARRKLIAAGDEARIALQQAQHLDDPQITDAARDVLAALPWFQANDPPLAIDLLRNYGTSSVPDRIGIVARLSDIAPADPVLLRLLQREDNEDVCWQIVAELRKDVSPSLLLTARQLDPATGGSAINFLSGAAWLTPIPKASPSVDRDRGRQLLSRAIELETDHPSYDGGQLDEAFDELVNVALYHDHPDEALRLRRLQCRRIGVSRDGFPSPFFSLLAVYAQNGPLHDLQNDLNAFTRFLLRPEALGTLSRVYCRLGFQSMAATLEQCSLASALTTETENLNGECFDRLGFTELAAANFRSILSRKDRNNDPWDVQARLHLAQLAAQREDDAAALNQVQLLLDDRKASDLSDEGVQQLQTEAFVHQLRLAEASRDQPAIERSVSSLLTTESADTDMCIELVPLLRRTGRGAEADRIFGSSYQPLKNRLSQGDSDPALLNELAWLCARCDMHLDEAMTWAREAVNDRPASAAFLDTNAEACFRSGKAAEAATLERRALIFDPGDLFMLRQLRRFEAATASQPAISPPAELH